MKDKLPQKTDKPWGYELLWAYTPKYAGKLLFVKKGHRLSLQYHKKKDETLYVHKGKAVIVLEASNGQVGRLEATPGYCFRVHPLTKHRIEALEDTMLFEVSTPELDDVERLEDDYGRV
jgi:mannose-6-phosphate isomerase-like protein (cupin superfamily)